MSKVEIYALDRSHYTWVPSRLTSRFQFPEKYAEK